MSRLAVRMGEKRNTHRIFGGEDRMKGILIFKRGSKIWDERLWNGFVGLS